MFSSPWLAMVLTLILCLVWMRLINFMTDKGIVARSVSRKVIHIGTGPIFLLCWTLFPETELSKYLAALVPFIIVLQLVLVGEGIIKDRTSILSMARTGEKSELLRGPLLYGIAFVLTTIFFWKTIYAVVAMMMLCGGDGIADLVGSRVRSPRFPWTKSKTLGGSVSMLLGGFLLSLIIFLFVQNSYFFPVLTVGRVMAYFFIISILATLVESFTPSDWDNLTVPAMALLTSILLF